MKMQVDWEDYVSDMDGTGHRTYLCLGLRHVAYHWVIVLKVYQVFLQTNKHPKLSMSASFRPWSFGIGVLYKKVFFSHISLKNIKCMFISKYSKNVLLFHSKY